MSAASPKAMFGGTYPTIEEITRNKLLDAGIACIDSVGIGKTTIRLIAETSGIARQTVYNYFKNKDELLSAALHREGITLGQAAAQYIERFDDVEDKFVQGFLFIHQHFPENPILAKVIEPGCDFFNTVGMRHYPYAQFGELVFGQVFRAFPYLSAQAESISELWIRNVMSFLTMPGPTTRTRDEIEEFVRLRLIPGIGLRPSPQA